MAALTSQEARAIMEKALHFSKAEACEVNINANAGGNIRFARNTVNTAGATEDTQLVIQSFFGQRAGTV
ncbi:MAG: TldD/PmbA family protein, partial [Acidobacteriota bacterium]